MDSGTRNELRLMVTGCRKTLESSLAEILEGQYGIDTKGQVADLSILGHLDPTERTFRDELVSQLNHIIASGFKPKDAVSQLVREVAYTHFNRLCAYKLLEQRGHIRETVSRGIESNGFLRYIAEYKEDYTLFSTGKQDVAYRHFLIWQGSTLSDEIGVLFSPYDPANRLFPPHRIIEAILVEINKESLKDIWKSDETIGWIYQYFTPKELRDKARSESQAPRNSYELAFRNQFFTPRYVVQFLTENTLGRIWYEMRQGKTSLATTCEYLVRYPHEVFLKSGESFPTQSEKAMEKSREKLLKDPWYIQYRERKDPRDLRVIDPACGSGHFLLYCFDLLEMIYREAWEDPRGIPFTESGKTLRDDYPNLKGFQKEIPGLILRHNLHGIDIDLRATQIATLALWLRAQRSFYDLGIPREQRPHITRSNIVCAEPMPGEKELLEEFIAILNPPVLGGLVRAAFEKMNLAGEAGSLLKIEEEIAQSIAAAKTQWLSRPKEVQLTLFPIDKKTQWQTSLYNVSGISDASFWDIAEQKVLEALHDYAKQVSNGAGYRRAVFAEDAARGFAFIELCGKQYDVVLMNPPFGAASEPSKEYISKKYPKTKNNIFATFIERGIELLYDNRGLLGAITSRTGFFIQSFSSWREDILLKNSPPLIIADLGSNVLDNALVETAVYTLNKKPLQQKNTIFFDLLNVESQTKGEYLKKIVNDNNCWIVKKTKNFSLIVNSPFNYWISENILKKFIKFSQFESNFGEIRMGLGTRDDFRFIRLFWEIQPLKINFISNSITRKTDNDNETFRENTKNNHYWTYFAKGGEYSNFYSDIHLVVNWKNDGEDIKNFPKSVLRNESYYFIPGLTWTRRTSSRFSGRALPTGSIISDQGNLILIFNEEYRLSSLGLFISNFLYSWMELSLGAADGAARTYEVGLLQKIPFIDSSSNSFNDNLMNIVAKSINLKIDLYRFDETDHNFIMPSVLEMKCSNLSQTSLKGKQKLDLTVQNVNSNLEMLDNIVYSLYDISTSEQKVVEEQINKRPSEFDNSIFDKINIAFELISYTLGSLFGRWDIRYATGHTQPPELPDPFAPLPACSPGMLQGDDGLPLLEAPLGYPLKIDDDGILVDDEYHPEDIITRLREILTLLWGDKADSIEREACEILGVKLLRDYFRKPGAGGFWDSHVKRYSKSRRKAPIYWLLQSSKRNYALWIYYPRLTPDTLFRALERYVKPKIQMEETRLAEMQSELKNAGTGGAVVKKLEKAVEKQELFVGELSDFKEKLGRAASLFLDPDHDDGVVLTIAPLHELVPWKEAGAYWGELLEGKYEWSSIGKQMREKGMVKE
ncbi:MAG: BREX-1 system adenine-specific DNA-methyltransferase PglX [Methanoregula sp.]|jgi:hypothetical protein